MVVLASEALIRPLRHGTGFTGKPEKHVVDQYGLTEKDGGFPWGYCTGPATVIEGCCRKRGRSIDGM
jgi:hypothetical protein